MYSSIRPGKIWYDTEGKRIHAHGGSVLYAEGKFWWYGENKEGITGTATGEQCKFRHHGIRCYSSTDLYNWKDEGIIVAESKDENHRLFSGYPVERPHILYNEKNKKYVLWAKTAPKDYAHADFSVCIGDSLHSLSFSHSVNCSPYFAGDFDLFVDGEKAYIVFESPHSEMVLWELNNEYTDLAINRSAHLSFGYPPLTREAPAYFLRNGRKFILTSGTTGYFPNSTIAYEITDLHGEWKDLGKVCRGDSKNNSFHAQFSSVFKHPHIPDLYIALGDRWLTDLEENLPDMEKFYLRRFGPGGKKDHQWNAIHSFSDKNLDEANYVWLPLCFDEKGNPYLEWRYNWTTEEFNR